MDRWYDAISLRYSVRSYSGGISSRDMVSLQHFADGCARHGIRIAVSRSDRIFSGKLLIPRISGTDCFAAVITKNGKDIFSGYIGEFFVLECVARGFGTCWLGASYRQSAAEEAIELEDDEAIACVISIGIPDTKEKRPLRKRSELKTLTDLSKADLDALPEWQMAALNCARIAPSAMNHQPWQFFVYPDAIGISNISRNLGYGMLDCGIAMLHAEIGARHSGVNVDWDMEKRDDEAILRLIEDDEYDYEEEYTGTADDGTEKESFDDSESFDGQGDDTLIPDTEEDNFN